MNCLTLFHGLLITANEKKFAWPSYVFRSIILMLVFSVYTHMQSMVHSHAVSGCKVAMDKLLLGQVGHSQCYLMAYL